MTYKILEKLQELCQECESNQPVKEVIWQKDPKTGLEWGPIAEKPMAWQEAMDWAKEQGGRLPTRAELLQLFDFGPKNIVKPMKSNKFWSLLSCFYYVYNAWYVNFNYSDTNNNDKIRDYAVRCVRP